MEKEELLAVVIPLEGKMLADDLAVLIKLKTTSAIKSIVVKKQVKHHKIGGKTVVDLEDFWKKTVR